MKPPQQLSNTEVLHFQRSYFTASRSSPPPSHLILTCSLSHSQLYLSSPNRLSSEVTSEKHRNHTCGLQRVLEHLYYMDLQNILPSPSYFILSQFPSFILLQLFTFSSFTFQNNVLILSTSWLIFFPNCSFSPFLLWYIHLLFFFYYTSTTSATAGAACTKPWNERK